MPFKIMFRNSAFSVVMYDREIYLMSNNEGVLSMRDIIGFYGFLLKEGFFSGPAEESSANVGTEATNHG